MRLCELFGYQFSTENCFESLAKWSVWPVQHINDNLWKTEISYLMYVLYTSTYIHIGGMFRHFFVKIDFPAVVLCIFDFLYFRF